MSNQPITPRRRGNNAALALTIADAMTEAMGELGAAIVCDGPAANMIAAAAIETAERVLLELAAGRFDAQVVAALNERFLQTRRAYFQAGREILSFPASEAELQRYLNAGDFLGAVLHSHEKER